MLSLDYLFLDCISRSCPRKNYIIFLVLPLTRHARPICTIHRSWTWQFFHVSLLHDFTERTRNAYFMIYLTRGLSRYAFYFGMRFVRKKYGKYIRIVLIKWDRVSVSFISISIDWTALEIDQPRPDETNGRHVLIIQCWYPIPHPRSPLFHVHPRDIDSDSRSIRKQID